MKLMNHHPPPLPISCMRRQLTANVGTNNAREMAKPGEWDPAQCDGYQHGEKDTTTSIRHVMHFEVGVFVEADFHSLH